MTDDTPPSLPAQVMTDDVVDKIAAEIGLIVGHHIETMYPEATKAVAWSSAKRSIQGIVRNAIASAGRAAEEGRIEDWIRKSKAQRRK